MNQQATVIPEADYKETEHAETENNTNSDWLAERKKELREVLENKSKELSQKAQDSLSKKMGHYHSAIQKASESLESDSEGQSAKIAANLAHQIKESADYIQNTSPEQIAQRASDHARKSPIIALGTAIAAGFLVGRIINCAQDQDATSAEA